MDTDGAILIDHFKNPRKKGVIPNPDLYHEILNRKCGDRIRFTARLEEGVIRDIRFEGEGCFYCLATASIVCNHVSGCQVPEVLAQTSQVREWLLNDGPDPTGPPEILALGEIKQYPMRITCVELAWKGLYEMLGTSQNIT